MIKNLIITISLLLFSTNILARGYRGNSDTFTNLIFGVILAIGSLCFYFYSYVNWQERQKNNEQPSDKDGLSDWIFTVFGYAIIALFASFPVALILKPFIQVDGRFTILFYTFPIMFGLLYFLRRT
ncbi:MULTISPECIES: putative four-helix membrane protein [Acinetobacter]